MRLEVYPFYAVGPDPGPAGESVSKRIWIDGAMLAFYGDGLAQYLVGINRLIV